MSTPKFHTLKVKDVRIETNDCVSLAFEIPENLINEYSYQAGQYITIKKNINGEELRRSYSICSSPSSKELRVAVKKVNQGVFSTYANEQIKTGDELEVMSPMGHFYQSEKTGNKHFIGFASGSGITPVISILKDVLEQNPENVFTLIYGNKNVASIIFREELEALKNIYIGRLQLIHILSRERLEVEMNYGRIDLEKCEQIFEKLIDASTIQEAFICGPEQMTLTVKDFLIAKGIDTKNVKFELFGTDASYTKKQETRIEEQENLGPISKVSIKVDERTIILDLPFNGKNILDAALASGADLPYACKGGVCCTCRAKVVKGEVRMDVNYALEKEEVEQGFVLTCQAHPITEIVEVDFDVR